MMRALVRRVVPRRLRNWLRSPARTLEDLTDEFLYRTGRSRTVELRPGWTVRCHPSAHRRAYAPLTADPDQVRELDAFIGEVRDGMVLYDLGAHFGVFSLAALHYGGRAACAVAVDPSPVAARMLGIQARLNGVADRLTVVRAAAAEVDGVMDMVPTGAIGAGYFVHPDPEHSAADRTSVPTVTVDDLRSVTGAAPTHLKIDVEGFEAAALRGAHDTLRTRPNPVVFLELHVDMIRRRGGDPEEPLALLAAANYHTFDGDGTPRTTRELAARGLVRLIARPTPDSGPRTGDVSIPR